MAHAHVTIDDRSTAWEYPVLTLGKVFHLVIPVNKGHIHREGIQDRQKFIFIETA
jgi:hypothetical protein